MLLYIFLASCTVLGHVVAVPSPLASEFQTLSKRCLNSATDRSCWGEYDLQTNYYDIVPDTGVVREYSLEITNGTGAPDGVEREVFLINGAFPGPTIYADWGDTVRVHVTNALANNGTTIHWHGVRQNYTNWNDGVPSVTQCPIAPGDSLTYEFRAAQYGTSWYHSHWGMQAWDGILGGIVFNGPASANYDEDLGVLLLNDWSHDTSEQQEYISQRLGRQPQQNGLINGTNVWGDGGSRFEVNFVAGKRYLFRIVNAAADTFYRLSFDNHTMEVISTDFVAIQPYNTTNIGIAIGQRYNVIVTASEDQGNFWLRAVPQVSDNCSDNENADNIRGVVRYNSSSTDDPTTPGYNITDSCADESIDTLVPVLALPASSNYSVENDYEVGLSGGELQYWNLAPTSFLSYWDYPSVLHVAEGNTTWSAAESAVLLPDANQWVYFVIQTEGLNIGHPIHLHGHDFWVLASGEGTYAPNDTTLKLTNGPRRDVAMLPGGGYLVIAFYTDNPGAWILHCHIAFHTVEGLSLQLIERESEMGFNDIATVNQTCRNWNTYAASSGIVQDDDGI